MRLRSHPLRLALAGAAHGCGASHQVGRHFPERGSHAPNDVSHQSLPLSPARQNYSVGRGSGRRHTLAMRWARDSWPGTPPGAQGNSSAVPMTNQMLRVVSKCKCPHASAERHTWGQAQAGAQGCLFGERHAGGGRAPWLCGGTGTGGRSAGRSRGRWSSGRRGPATRRQTKPGVPTAQSTRGHQRPGGPPPVWRRRKRR